VNEKIIVTDKKRTLIFINIVITCIAGSMLATALTTALPPLVKDFNISVNTGQWLTSGYSLAMAIMMPLTAFLITRFPTRKLYCTAVAVFLTGLFICIISTNFPLMMLGRIIQATGNGMLTSMAQVIVLSIFPPEKRGSAMGWYGLSIGAAPVISPTIAGIIIDHSGWRMIFVIAFAIMLISFIFALFVFENVLDTVKKEFDISSFIMSAFAFGGITLAVGNIGVYGLLSAPVLLALILGIIGAVLFIRRQLQLNVPFLDIRILKVKEYAIGVIGSMFLYFIMMGSSILMPLYVQNTLGLSATIAGLITLPGSLVTAIISPFAGKIYDKVGMKILFVTGSALLVLSNFAMIILTVDMSVWFAAVFNILRSIAIGCLMMPLITWGTSYVDQSKTADSSALLTSLRTIAGAIGSAAFVTIMTFSSGISKKPSAAAASMQGVTTAYFCMGILSVVMLCIAIWGTSNKKNI
jgi:EmrB/QacA subfamily drug resistance transporter